MSKIHLSTVCFKLEATEYLLLLLSSEHDFCYCPDWITSSGGTGKVLLGVLDVVLVVLVVVVVVLGLALLGKGNRRCEAETTHHH